MRASWRLLGLIETGELAELYEGCEEPGGGRVVIKLFHERTSDPRYAAVLARTYDALGARRHEGLVPLVGLGFVRGRLAVVREAVSGHTLGTVLRRLHAREAHLPPLLALSLLLRLLEAMQVAHEAGVVHGALTPGNVLLSRAGVPALVDFGALQALLAVPRLERAFAAQGRGAYRAPELGRGEPPTPQADVYSLGALAYELLTRRQALLLDAGGRHRAASVPPPSRLDRHIPPRVDPLILRALEATPSRRFRSATEFASTLRNVLTAQGGVPGPEELRHFLAELLPPEDAPVAAGPLPFAEPFTLTPVSSASQAQGDDAVPETSVVARPAYSPTLGRDAAPDTLRELRVEPLPTLEDVPAAQAPPAAPTQESPRVELPRHRRRGVVGLALGGLVGLGLLLGVLLREPREVRETPLQATEVEARNEGQAYLTLRSSLDVQVTIDGVPVDAPLPLVRYPVKPGYRRIVVETRDRTRQRKEFEVHFGRGQHRQLEPLF